MPPSEPHSTTSSVVLTDPDVPISAAGRLTLTVHRGPDALRIAPSGDLDLATAETLLDEVMHQLQGPDRLLVLDFAGVAFCDSSGINSLVKIRKHCDRNHTQLQLTNLAPNIHRVLVDLTGLGNYLGVQESA